MQLPLSVIASPEQYVRYIHLLVQNSQGTHESCIFEIVKTHNISMFGQLMYNSNTSPTMQLSDQLFDLKSIKVYLLICLEENVLYPKKRVSNYNINSEKLHQL